MARATPSIIVTHDAADRPPDRPHDRDQGRPHYCRHADRSRQRCRHAPPCPRRAARPRCNGSTRGTEAFRMAIRSMVAHKLRTFLTMLGIIIGIASVVSVVALGPGQPAGGARKHRLDRHQTPSTSIPAPASATAASGRIRTLLPSDADAIATQPYADSVTAARLDQCLGAVRQQSPPAPRSAAVGAPTISGVNGLDPDPGPRASMPPASTAGRRSRVIDTNAVSALFNAWRRSHRPGDPSSARCRLRVIGVVAITSSFGPGNSNPSIYIPYTTAMDRILGQFLSEPDHRARRRRRRTWIRRRRKSRICWTRLHGKDRFLPAEHEHHPRNDSKYEPNPHSADLGHRRDFAGGRRHRAS